MSGKRQYVADAIVVDGILWEVVVLDGPNVHGRAPYIIRKHLSKEAAEGIAEVV